MSDYDDYDDYNDYEDYDDYDPDAPDDWEEELRLQEEKEKEEKALREAMEERKIASRASKAKAREDASRPEEEAPPVDIQREEDILRQEAHSTAEAASSMGEAVSYIGDLPVDSLDEAVALGKAIAARIAQQQESSAFEPMLAELYAALSKEFQSVEHLNQVHNIAMVLKDREKRLEKLEKRRGKPVGKKSAGGGGLDAFEAADDIRGGDVADEDPDQQW